MPASGWRVRAVEGETTVTASGTTHYGNGFSQDVFAAPLLCPLRQDMEEDAEGDGKRVEDNDGDTEYVSNTVRHDLLGAGDTIIMSAPPP